MNSVQKAVLVPYEVYQRYIIPHSLSKKSKQSLITEDPHSDISLKKYKSLITKDPKGLLGVIEPPKVVSENLKRKNSSHVYKKETKKQRWLTS
jgi:hypothetical protein